ncbi:MAG: (2Fe-2S)-binding protein [Treponema sp.]|nr:(2Fe-2S)-binding protein [Treponema sp.]
MSGDDERFIMVNGIRRELTGAQAEGSLLEYLREELDLTGAKNGCGVGACGACTVLVDGQARRACITKMSSALGKEIVTIEGLEGPGGELHPLQQAFIESGAIQCGFCTPGMIMSSLALLGKEKRPSRERIRQAISGNLCRCTGYQQIVDAVELAARRMYPEA